MSRVHGGTNPLDEAALRQTIRRLALLTNPLPRTLGPVINVKGFGAVGDNLADDTAAIQAALDAAAADKTGATVFFPPGFYKVTDTLEIGNAPGLCIGGSGYTAYNSSGFNTAMVGSAIVAHGMGGKPVLDFNGTTGFAVRDMAIYGNSSESLAGAAAIGVRVRSAVGLGAGFGTFYNVHVSYCVEGVNFGNGGEPINAADSTFFRCVINQCTTGFRSDQAQAVNFGFYDCAMLEVGDCFSLVGGNLFASMFATNNCQRIVYVETAGINIGHTTFINVRIDGQTYRTVVYEVAAGASGDRSWGTFIDVHAVQGQPAGGARFKTNRSNHIKLIGAAGLCSAADGPLMDLDGSAGPVVMLLIGCELPASPADYAGTISGDAEYRVRDCVDQDTYAFLANTSNDGSDGGGTGPVTKVMSADQTIADSGSAMTLVNITEIVFAIGANETKAFQFSLNAGDANATTGHDFSLTVPVGASMWLQGTAVESGDNPGGSPQNARITTSGSRLTINPPGDANIITMTAYVANGATPGNVQLQVAQSANSTGADLKIKQGSFGVASKV